MKSRNRFAALMMAACLLLSVPAYASAETSANADNSLRYPEGLVIADAADFAAPDGKIVCMTVDGVLQDVKTGDYVGHEVVIWTLDEQTADIAGAGGGPGGASGDMGGSGGMSAEAMGGGMGPPPEEQGGATYVSYRSALLIDDNEINENASALSAVRNAETLTADEIIGAKIDILGSRTNVLWNEDGTKVEPEGNIPGNSDGVWDWVTDYDVGVYNGVTIIDSDVRIRDTAITYEGNGGDDFHMFGTAIGVAGASHVVLDNVDIRTHGVIATALSVSGTSDVLVRDSFILTKGTANDTWYKYNEKGMTSAAWVLGGRGTVRSTNALGNATMTFWNTYAESNGWGVYSGDEAKGITQYIVDSTANIPSVGEEGYEEGDFAAGYGTYCLSGTQTYVLGSNFDVPDFAIIVAGGRANHVIGPSSYENLMEYVGEDSTLYAESNGFSDVEEKNSVFKSDLFGVMWHSSAAGSVNFLPGSELYVGDTAFLIKGSASLSNSPTINMTDCVLEDLDHDGDLSIVHLFESDDAGQTDEISLHHDYKWAIAAQYLTEEKELIEGNTRATVTANFKDMELTGDCWNSVYTARQQLVINLDNTTLTGTVSSADVEHKNKSYLYAYNADGEIICTDLNGRAYVTLRTEPYTATSMNGTSTTTVYIYPAVDETGAFVYDEADANVYESCGYAIYYTDAQYLGQTVETAAPTLNDPVSVNLTNGSVWNVTGTGYLASLTIDETSAVTGASMTVEGIPTELAPGTYEGEIVITPIG